MDDAWLASIMLTAVVVAVFAGLGFNRPSWVRSFTSPSRYRVAASAYIVVCLALMTLVYLVLLVAMWMPSRTWAWSIGAQWAAMVLTLGLQSTAVWHNGPRSWLQRLAGIPQEAYGLAKQLADSACVVAPVLQEEVRTLLLSRGIDSDRDWLPLAQPAHRLLVQMTALFLQVRDWERQPAFRVFCMEAKHDLNTMRQRFDRLTFRVSRAFESIEKLGEMRHLVGVQCGLAPRTLAPGQAGALGDGERDDDIDSLMRRLVSQMIADICEDIVIFHRDVCLITARGLLMTSRNHKQLDAAACGLGLHLDQPRPKRGYGALALTMLALYFGISVQSAQLASSGVEMSASMRAFLITVNVSAALVFAIVPKMHWGFANSGLMRKTPFGFVLGAGVAAALFAAGVNMVVGAIQYGGWSGAMTRLVRGAIYLHMPFLTAFTMAWLVQDHRWGDVGSGRMRRGLDGLVLSAVWLPAWWCARMLRVLVVQSGAWQDLLTQQALFSGMTWALMGAAIGYLLPESVRVGRPRQSASVQPSAFETLASWMRPLATFLPVWRARGPTRSHTRML